MSRDREEAYEMTRSFSGESSSITEQRRQHRDTYDGAEEEEEEAQLLTKEEQQTDSDDDEDTDDEWAVIIEEGGDNGQVYSQDSPTFRYACIGIAIGLFFVFFKFGAMKLSDVSGHTQRGMERLYNNGSEYFASTVILISLDGFRPDYMERNITPHMNQLASDGIMAKYMHPVFPPSTFPNHWTLVTGLYPESHGIVANLFYDPTFDAFFSHTDSSITSDQKWWKGQSIWTTCKFNNKRSGSIMWPGAEANMFAPDLVIGFNDTMGIKEKIDITLKWLDLPYDDRPQIITVYVPQIDQEGHRNGPNGSKLNDYIKEADDVIGYLGEELKKRNLENHVHTVIVSDHGMAETNDSKLIYYDDILSEDLLKHVGNREALPLLDLRPAPDASSDTIQKIYDQLFNYTQSVFKPHFEVYLKKDMPDRYHYKNSDRITPIVAIPEVGYTFVTHSEIAKKGGKFRKGGNHGYDNLADEMRGIFLAKGPKLDNKYRAGTILAPFFNIEVYRFLTELLNVDAAPNNGTLDADFPIVYQSPL